MVTDATVGHTPEQVHLIQDPASGLAGAIVIDTTTLGPAAGGCRIWDYVDSAAMVEEACRLAKGMSYKNALAGLPLGGGKAVLQRPSDPTIRPAMLSAFGRAVAALRGDYVTAEDVGTSVQDMQIVAGKTRYVSGLPAQVGGVGGDPSPWTARGVFLAMRLAVRRRLGRDLAGCTVAIQGVGSVGSALANMLHAIGAKLILADINPHAVARTAVALGADVASVDAIASSRADVFAPCALGGVLNERTIGRLQAKVVCGAANNQLRDASDAARLAGRDILYAPDFAVNAGGIISVAGEYLGWSREAVDERVEATPLRLARVLDLAAEKNWSSHESAEHLARLIIANGSTRRDRAA